MKDKQSHVVISVSVILNLSYALKSQTTANKCEKRRENHEQGEKSLWWRITSIAHSSELSNFAVMEGANKCTFFACNVACAVNPILIFNEPTNLVSSSYSLISQMFAVI